EHVADRVRAGLGQGDAQLVRLALEEPVRRLHQDAGAVAGARVGADRAAVLEVEQDLQPVLDDAVRLAALDVGDEADPAGILLQRRIEQAARGRQGLMLKAVRRAHDQPLAQLLVFRARPRSWAGAPVLPAAPPGTSTRARTILVNGRLSIVPL